LPPNDPCISIKIHVYPYISVISTGLPAPVTPSRRALAAARARRHLPAWTHLRVQVTLIRRTVTVTTDSLSPVLLVLEDHWLARELARSHLTTTKVMSRRYRTTPSYLTHKIAVKIGSRRRILCWVDDMVREVLAMVVYFGFGHQRLPYVEASVKSYIYNNHFDRNSLKISSADIALVVRAVTRRGRRENCGTVTIVTSVTDCRDRLSSTVAIVTAVTRRDCRGRCCGFRNCCDYRRCSDICHI
jgi:hypothetical protein